MKQIKIVLVLLKILWQEPKSLFPVIILLQRAKGVCKKKSL
jgi:hypothetical protein